MTTRTPAPRGELTTIDGRSAIVHTRDLAHPPERVWAAVTTPEGLAAWFPCRVDGDLTTAGAQLSFTFPGPGSDDGAGDVTHGTVLESDPPRTLRFTWDAEELRISIEPTADGCRLTFADLVPDEHVPAAARTAAGWHVCLDELTVELDAGGGVAPGPAATDEFREVYDLYVAAGFPHDVGLPGDA